MIFNSDYLRVNREKSEYLQKKLRKSEMERRELEQKFQDLMRNRDKCERSIIKTVKNRFEDDKKRSNRNQELLQMLERVDYQSAILSARTERLKELKNQHEMYLMRNWRSNRAIQYSHPSTSITFSQSQSSTTQPLFIQQEPIITTTQQFYDNPQQTFTYPLHIFTPLNRNDTLLKSNFVKYLSELNHLHPMNNDNQQPKQNNNNNNNNTNNNNNNINSNNLINVSGPNTPTIPKIFYDMADNSNSCNNVYDNVNIPSSSSNQNDENLRKFISNNNNSNKQQYNIQSSQFLPTSESYNSKQNIDNHLDVNQSMINQTKSHINHSDIENEMQQKQEIFMENKQQNNANMPSNSNLLENDNFPKHEDLEQPKVESIKNNSIKFSNIDNFIQEINQKPITTQHQQSNKVITENQCKPNEINENDKEMPKVEISMFTGNNTDLNEQHLKHQNNIDIKILQNQNLSMNLTNHQTMQSIKSIDSTPQIVIPSPNLEQIEEVIYGEKVNDNLDDLNFIEKQDTESKEMDQELEQSKYDSQPEILSDIVSNQEINNKSPIDLQRTIETIPQDQQYEYQQYQEDGVQYEEKQQQENVNLLQEGQFIEQNPQDYQYNEQQYIDQQYNDQQQYNSNQIPEQQYLDIQYEHQQQEQQPLQPYENEQPVIYDIVQQESTEQQPLVDEQQQLNVGNETGYYNAENAADPLNQQYTDIQPNEYQQYSTKEVDYTNNYNTDQQVPEDHAAYIPESDNIDQNYQYQQEYSDDKQYELANYAQSTTDYQQPIDTSTDQYDQQYYAPGNNEEYLQQNAFTDQYYQETTNDPNYYVTDGTQNQVISGEQQEYNYNNNNNQAYDSTNPSQYVAEDGSIITNSSDVVTSDVVEVPQQIIQGSNLNVENILESDVSQQNEQKNPENVNATNANPDDSSDFDFSISSTNVQN